jgi:hypothetical protein
MAPVSDASSGYEFCVTNSQICQDLLFFVEHQDEAVKTFEAYKNTWYQDGRDKGRGLWFFFSDPPATDRYHAGFLRTIAYILGK